MKRTPAILLVPVFCLVMLTFSFSAMGAENRSHTGGRFLLDIAGHNDGMVKPIEGDATPSEKPPEKPASVPEQTIAPQPARNVAPVPQQTLHHTPQVVRPVCPNPPCGLGQQAAQDGQEKKKAGSSTTKKHSDTESAIISNMK